VELTVTPKGRDDVTGDWIAEKDIHPATLMVEQVPREALSVTFDRPPTPGGDKKIGYMTEFTIQAEVCNAGFATLEFDDPDAIWPTLVYTPDDSLEVLDVDYGILHMEGKTDLKKYECTTVTWRVRCIRAEVEPGAGEEGDNQWLRTYFEVKAKGVANTCIDCFAADSDMDKVIQKYLIVEILDPNDDSIWQPEVPGGEEECSEHNIKFAVTPYGGNLVNGQAQLTVDGVNVINEGSSTLDFNTYEDGRHAVIDDGETAIFEAFHVKCVSTGEGLIEIEVDGSTNNPLATTYRNSDSQTVEQLQNRSDLTIDILSPLTSNWFSHGDTFTVTAVVVAAGDPADTADAENLEATLTVTPEDDGPCMILGGATKTRTYLEAGGDWTVTWLVKCAGLCNVGLEAKVEWDDFLCSEDHFSDVDEPETVHMFPLKPVIYQYPNTVTTMSTFDIHAKVYNLGCDCYEWECPECGVPDVWATIEILEGQAELALGEQPDKYIGDVICPEIYPQEAEWTVKCLGPGTVKIRVKVWTNKDAYPGDTYGDVLPGGKVLVSYSDFVIVDQIPSLKKYTIQLCKDWNYFSLPLIPKDDTDNIESEVLASVYGNVVDVWAYDAFSEMWSVHVPALSPAVWGYLPGLGELTDMVDGPGYIIRMNYPDIVEGEGLLYPDPQFPQAPPIYDVAQGWNLIGFKTLDWDDDCTIDDMSAGDYFYNIESCATCDLDEIVGDEIRQLFTYECGYPDGVWKQLPDDDACMEIGQAYWAYFMMEGEILPPWFHPGPCTF
jgi:hypothetical protein